MPEYRVGIWLDEVVEVTIIADSAEHAEKLAFTLGDEMGGTDYPKEYSPDFTHRDYGVTGSKEIQEA
tara:strand:+ start:10505 stop:10705 length:201 start_codon:yes stop_codon:yes gene_type:complete